VAPAASARRSRIPVGENARRAGANYICSDENAEELAGTAMKDLAERQVAQQQLDVLRGAAAVQLAQIHALRDRP